VATDCNSLCRPVSNCRNRPYSSQNTRSRNGRLPEFCRVRFRKAFSGLPKVIATPSRRMI
jgi:hypothetical protein